MPSRYRNTKIIDNKYQETFDFPKIDFDKIPMISVRISDGERFDQLAHKHYNDGTLYWVIMLANDIHYFFDFASGQIIKIPIDPQDVLKYF